MSYKAEYSKHHTVADLVNSEKVKKFLSEMKIIHHGKGHFEKVDEFILTKKDELNGLLNDLKIKYVFAFDGSKTQIALDTGFPGAEVGILKISQCFVQLELMKEYESKQFAHPAEYDEIFINQSFEATIPGFNVGSEEYNDPKDFFRSVIYSQLKNNYNSFLDVLIKRTGQDIEKKTFLQSYLNVLVKRPEATSCSHPCERCNYLGIPLRLQDFYDEHSSDDNFRLNHKVKCHCKNSPKDVFITDFLRFHEGFSNSGSNDGLYSQVMSFFEKMIFLNLLHILEDFFINEEKNPLFEDCAFILDGPLALYNYAAWFSQSLADEIIRLSDKSDMLIIGVEKTGHFVEHLRDLDAISSPEDKALEPGFLFFLDDKYIKKFVKFSSGTTPYGQNSYFGKKLYYKNHQNQLFVINLAFNSIEDRHNYLNGKNNQQYRLMQKRLKDLAWLLEKFSSSRYENALSFVSMAHENASISSNYFSKRVIDDFVKEKLDK